jgi:hypothetical protein
VEIIPLYDGVIDNPLMTAEIVPWHSPVSPTFSSRGRRRRSSG